MTETLGLLFADISGTTRLYRKIATDEARHQLERCVKRMERAIELFKGTLLVPTVDQMVAGFPTADDAVLAAAEMQRRISDLPPLSGVRLSIRIGVHLGEIDRRGPILSGSGIDAGRALLGLAEAGQIFTCARTAAALSRPQQEDAYVVEGMSLIGPGSETQVYQVAWQGGAKEAAAPAAKEAKAPPIPVRLAIRWDGRAYLVDAETTFLQVGRDRDCDLLLRGSKVSRKHARFEARPEGFVLIDQSSNGTYLYVDGSGERRLHSEEVALRGRGRVAFGHTTEKDDGEVLDFELS